MSDCRVRLATPSDADAIARIYNQGIEDRVATLETELRTPEERREWMASRSPRHPVIVAEVAEPGATVVGWGSLNVFNAREAYRFVADFSIYIERGWRGRGVGQALLERLVALAREHGFHKLVLSAFPTNVGGMALYTKLGFRTVGIYKDQGQLDGQCLPDARTGTRHHCDLPGEALHNHTPSRQLTRVEASRYRRSRLKGGLRRLGRPSPPPRSDL